MTQVADTNIEQLASGFSGRVLRPGDAGYDEARTIFNGMIDRKPLVIAQPATTEDVVKAVKFGRENGLLTSVKGGGHSASGHAIADGGLEIDLSLLKAITVDPEKRTAVAEGGVCWGEFDAATQAHGLAVTGGRVPSTGIGGLTLGSGSGWLERKLGYTVDNMMGAEVVTADGEVLHASESENQELFWGLRGGGGNFGVVTKFEYRLHPIGPMVFGGMLIFPRPRAVELIKAYRDFMETAPDDIGGGIALLCAPPLDFVPEPLHGMPIVAMIICYTGKPEDGEAAIKPLLDLQPVMNMTQPMPYVEVQKLIEEGNPPGRRQYWKADMYPELPDDAIEALANSSNEPASTMTTIILQPTSGAVQKVADDATAIGWRSAKWAIHVLGTWEDATEDEKQIAWVRNVHGAVQPWAQKGAYLNYLMDEGQQAIEDSFGAQYKRMVALKNEYDPTNFFSMNQNIKPTA
jgi:FAD/FMN-containing dehydrogenase